MERYHKRMPVVLDDESAARWLEPRLPVPAALELLRPCAAAGLEAFPVKRVVNKAGYDAPDCLERVSL